MATQPKLKSHRYCAGGYKVSLANDSGRVVDVQEFRRSEGASFTGWVARAEWSNSLYSDPCSTKRDAMRSAETFLTAEWAR